MSELQNNQKKIIGSISALKTTKQTGDNSKKLSSEKGGSIDAPENLEQLSEARNKKKKNASNKQTSLDRLLQIFSANRGNGLETMRFLRKVFIEAVMKIDSKIFEILTEETIKALGCSQEQTYKGYPKLQNFSLLSDKDGIFIPVKSVDLFGNLKIDPKTPLGFLYYEKPPSDILSIFINYGGILKYPMNRELNTRLQNLGSSFQNEYKNYYKGMSQNELFDIYYTDKDQYGMTGDFFRIFLLDKGLNPDTDNKVGNFITDYYKSIKIVEGTNFLANLINQLVGAIDMKFKLGLDTIEANQKFTLLVQRILGLCFDNRKEIDVSGTAKVSELEALDNSFWEVTNSENNLILEKISDIQNNVVEFKDCGNVKLPVNFESLVDQLTEFKETFNEDSPEQNTEQALKILDSISNNEKWKFLVPTDADIELKVTEDIIKAVTNALIATVLSPKNLLPLYIMIGAMESEAIKNLNPVITDLNRSIRDINSITDFMKYFKNFNIEVISKINAIFLETLFEIIKRDIFILLRSIIQDIARENFNKKYTMILRLLEVAKTIATLVSDYRKCKSLIEDILRLLRLISLTARTDLPDILLLAADLLPGKSSIRAATNTYEILESLGIPTEPLPGGSPNLMNQMILAVIQGMDKEEAENGKVRVAINPLTLKISGKSF